MSVAFIFGLEKEVEEAQAVSLVMQFFRKGGSKKCRRKSGSEVSCRNLRCASTPSSSHSRLQIQGDDFARTSQTSTWKIMDRVECDESFSIGHVQCLRLSKQNDDTSHHPSSPRTPLSMVVLKSCE